MAKVHPNYLKMLADPAICDNLLAQHEIFSGVVGAIDALRAMGREPTPENVVDLAHFIGWPEETCLLISALVARHLGAEGRG